MRLLEKNVNKFQILPAAVVLIATELSTCTKKDSILLRLTRANNKKNANLCVFNFY